MKIHKYVETEQLTLKQQIGQKNYKGIQKISGDKQEQQQNIPKLIGYSKNSTKREVYSSKFLP